MNKLDQKGFFTQSFRIFCVYFFHMLQLLFKLNSHEKLILKIIWKPEDPYCVKRGMNAEDKKS